MDDSNFFSDLYSTDFYQENIYIRNFFHFVSTQSVEAANISVVLSTDRNRFFWISKLSNVVVQ